MSRRRFSAASRLPTWPAIRRRRIKLLAAILLAGTGHRSGRVGFRLQRIAPQAGRAEAQPIDPAASSLAELPLARLARVDVKKLTDEQLVDLYQRADHYRHIAALRHLAHEVIARPGLDEKIEKAEVYGLLAQIEPDSGQAVSYLDQARHCGRGYEEIDRALGFGRVGTANFSRRSGRRGSPVAPYSRSAHS